MHNRVKEATTGLVPALITTVMLLAAAPAALAQDTASPLAAININTADAELLAELPGIGASKAAAIVEERETNGPFQSLEDLARVSGIGEATVAALSDEATL